MIGKIKKILKFGRTNPSKDSSEESNIDVVAKGIKNDLFIGIIESPNNPKPVSYDVGEKIKELDIELGENIHESVVQGLCMKQVYDLLYDISINSNKDWKEEFKKYVTNTSKIISSRRDILGNCIIPEKRGKKERQDPKGCIIDHEKVINFGIDPSYVVVGRITYPGINKPERFWSTDLYEVCMNLHETGEQAHKDILISTLSNIMDQKYGGCIQDIIDTDQITLQQIKETNFDQQDLLGRFKWQSLFDTI